MALDRPLCPRLQRRSVSHDVGCLRELDRRERRSSGARRRGTAGRRRPQARAGLECRHGRGDDRAGDGDRACVRSRSGHRRGAGWPVTGLEREGACSARAPHAPSGPWCPLVPRRCGPGGRGRVPGACAGTSRPHGGGVRGRALASGVRRPGSHVEAVAWTLRLGSCTRFSSPSTFPRRPGPCSSSSRPRTSPPRCPCSLGMRARNRRLSVSRLPVARVSQGFSDSAWECRRRPRSPTWCSVLPHSYWWRTVRDVTAALATLRPSRRLRPAGGAPDSQEHVT